MKIAYTILWLNIYFGNYFKVINYKERITQNIKISDNTITNYCKLNPKFYILNIIDNPFLVKINFLNNINISKIYFSIYNNTNLDYDYILNDHIDIYNKTNSIIIDLNKYNIDCEICTIKFYIYDHVIFCLDFYNDNYNNKFYNSRNEAEQTLNSNTKNIKNSIIFWLINIIILIIISLNLLNFIIFINKKKVLLIVFIYKFR